MCAAGSQILGRVDRPMVEAIERLGLDLSGLVICTEAGAGPFAVTAPLAARAGADHVIALAGPWGGRSERDVGRETQELAELFDVAKRVSVVSQRSLAHFAAADVVTNLGFVRPIDREVVAALKPTAAIAYMREAWEVRHEDVDLAACRERGIPVFATDERHPDVRVFADCGLLAVKLLFEARVDVGRGLVVVASGDPFGPVIVDCLRTLGADARLIPPLLLARHEELLSRAEALVVADLLAPGCLVGASGVLEATILAQWAPQLAVVAFAGGVDSDAVSAAGLRCVPVTGSRTGRMGQTLAALGPRPVIDLHGAGLKVGAAATRGRRQGLTGKQLTEYVCRAAPAAPLADA